MSDNIQSNSSEAKIQNNDPENKKTQTNGKKNHTERNVWQLRVVWGSEIRFFIVLSEENYWLLAGKRGYALGIFCCIYLYTYNTIYSFGWASLPAAAPPVQLTMPSIPVSVFIVFVLSVGMVWANEQESLWEDDAKTSAIVGNGGGIQRWHSDN